MKIAQILLVVFGFPMLLRAAGAAPLIAGGGPDAFDGEMGALGAAIARLRLRITEGTRVRAHQH